MIIPIQTKPAFKVKVNGEEIKNSDIIDFRFTKANYPGGSRAFLVVKLTQENYEFWNNCPDKSNISVESEFFNEKFIGYLDFTLEPSNNPDLFNSLATWNAFIRIDLVKEVE